MVKTYGIGKNKSFLVCFPPAVRLYFLQCSCFHCEHVHAVCTVYTHCARRNTHMYIYTLVTTCLLFVTFKIKTLANSHEMYKNVKKRQKMYTWLKAIIWSIFKFLQSLFLLYEKEDAKIRFLIQYFSQGLTINPEKGF